MIGTDSKTAALPADTAVSVRNLVKNFEVGGGLLSNRPKGIVSAVSGVSFDIPRGATPGTGGGIGLR